jgi:hypothetical protein
MKPSRDTITTNYEEHKTYILVVGLQLFEMSLFLTYTISFSNISKEQFNVEKSLYSIFVFIVRSISVEFK